MSEDRLTESCKDVLHEMTNQNQLAQGNKKCLAGQDKSNATFLSS